MTEPTLAQRVGTFTAEVHDLRETMDVVVARSRRLRRVVMVTVVSVTLDILLSVAVVILVHGQQVATTQIKAQQAQTASTRSKVLCPLYEVLLSSVNPARRAAMPPAQRQTYDRAVGVIQSGAAALHCTP